MTGGGGGGGGVGASFLHPRAISFLPRTNTFLKQYSKMRGLMAVKISSIFFDRNGNKNAKVTTDQHNYVWRNEKKKNKKEGTIYTTVV